MNLKAIKFCRFNKQKYEWSIEGKPANGVYNQWVTFEDINLIVGKNATGKSKTVNSIRQLGDLLAGKVKLSNLNQDAGWCNIRPVGWARNRLYTQYIGIPTASPQPEDVKLCG